MVIMKKILMLLLTLCSFAGTAYSDLTWLSPVAISTALTNASDPHVVIDSSGNATVVWVESGVIKASRFDGTSWSSPPATLSSTANSSSPRLDLDSTSGDVTAIWVENTQIESALYSGGSWSSETSPISGTGASNPSLAVDSSGNAVAVWVRSGYIESSSRISGTWNSTVAVLSAASSNNPHVAISSFGTAIATWHSVISGADVIVSDILTISSNTWAATKNVFSGTASLFHNYPKIAIDANGNANVAWIRYNLVDSNAYENVQVIASSLTQGASAWAIPTILSDSGIRNPADLTIKLKFDTSGNALAVWTNSYDGMTFVIEASEKLFGAPSWQGFVLPESPSIYSFGIDVAMAAGTALLTSMSWDGASSIIIASSESDTAEPLFQAWTALNPFSTGSDNGYPQSAMTLNGSTFNAVTVWISFDGSNAIINASTGSETMIAPPTSVSATQSVIDFGVYNDYTNTITWDASSDPNVMQYNIFRNGVFFTGVGPDTLQFVDHNQIQGGTVTYGVAAFTIDFRQSAIATYTLFP